ncbi:MAG TPA: carbohydrate-binding protein, partial [Actinophytocola sp.]|nr:carbohydrate-binding protein [Actinophytocola sp.]
PTTVASVVTEGDPQAVTLSLSGLPPGATATFDPASIRSGDSTTLTIATTAGTPTGTTQVTISADGTDADRTTRLSLTVGTAPGCDAPAWNAATAYATGDVVSHNGHEWESTWYSTGAEPGAPGSWAVWRDAGTC